MDESLGRGPEEVYPGVYLVRDTCNVFVIVDASDAATVDGRAGAITIDFGSGIVLDLLEEMGVGRISDVLMTHHHRDQGQGLGRAVAHGARIHVPPVEVDLFAHVDQMWATRQLDNDYNVRQDRFSLLEPVPVSTTVPEYRRQSYGGVEVQVIPTPGHTVGSVTYVLHRDGLRLGFTGDLIYAPGKVWSLAACQWSYTSHEGPAMVVLSCYLLQDEHLDAILPSHGYPIHDPGPALELLVERMQYYVDSRRDRSWDLKDRLRRPFVSITPHLLLNRSALSCSYVLLSDSGEALIVDYGYDMTTGLPTGTDRAARRPWLASLPALREQFGVHTISVALPTHYHDDHVAGMTLLREVHGTEIWSPANVAPVLADPWAYDLPCQWYEPIASDRVLDLGESFTWNEYTVTVHEQPGHTLFAAAFEVEVDEVTVMFTGDQQEGLGVPEDRREILNYQYRNRFRIDDYVRSAALYQQVAPGLLLSGHWEPRWADEQYLQYLAYAGEDLRQMHHALLPLEDLDLGSDGVMARITPYRSQVGTGRSMTLSVSVRNPHPYPARAMLDPVVPHGWLPVRAQQVELGAHEETDVKVELLTPHHPQRRARVAVDLTIGALRLGQHAEALIDVIEDRLTGPRG